MNRFDYGKEGIKNITKKQLIEMLSQFDDDMEVGFYLEGFGDFLLEGVYSATNMETNKPSITIDFTV